MTDHYSNDYGADNLHYSLHSSPLHSEHTTPLNTEPLVMTSPDNLYNPTRSTLYIITLTLIVGALQLAWSVEFSEATPFLLSLGVSKHILALIWLAGPLSGTLGQPIVGLLSDKCNLHWGRRRPFILGGCLATTISLVYLSHSTSIIGWFLPSDDLTLINRWTVPFASIGIYILDFSIAVIQASSRALIVDVVPTKQQQIANAWAARMIGTFNIVGFWLGTLDLKMLFPWIGNTQFKVLSILVATIMILLTGFCCYVITERNPQTDLTIRMERKKQQKKLKELGINEDETSTIIVIQSFFKQVISSIYKLPRQVKIVCYAEFFAWIGYFPMLFYTSTYVGELYLYEIGYNNPNLLPPDNKQELLDESTRRGTLALLVHAIVTLIVDLFLPYLLEHFKQFKKLNLKTVWIYSHAVFICATFSTFFIRSSTQAIIMFGFLGIPWGCAVWIPFVLISEEISRIKDIKAKQIYSHHQKPKIPSSLASLSSASSDFTDQSSSLTRGDTNDVGDMYLSSILINKYDELEYDSGILLAIHNVFVSAPQMFSSLASSLLFALLKKDDGDDSYDNSLAWTFRMGGVVCIFAFIIGFKVKNSHELLREDEEELKDIS